MFQNLTIFRTAADMAKHAGARQAVVTRNVANADTPDYQAQHIRSFQESYRPAGPLQMKATRHSHLGIAPAGAQSELRLTSAEPSPNGNTVSIEDEMLDAVAISREHSRALAVYRLR